MACGQLDTPAALLPLKEPPQFPTVQVKGRHRDWSGGCGAEWQICLCQSRNSTFQANYRLLLTAHFPQKVTDTESKLPPSRGPTQHTTQGILYQRRRYVLVPGATIYNGRPSEENELKNQHNFLNFLSF